MSYFLSNITLTASYKKKFNAPKNRDFNDIEVAAAS